MIRAYEFPALVLKKFKKEKKRSSVKCDISTLFSVFFFENEKLKLV